tara:strand:- start:506 stop:673 length:168 start_codon:yes stop_codon:yes gene_type:complete
MNKHPTNSKQWQKNSDDWVKTMTKSKENKELYQNYVAECMGKKQPDSYIDWLKNK